MTEVSPDGGEYRAPVGSLRRARLGCELAEFIDVCC
jgi:hypothetical protein